MTTYEEKIKKWHKKYGELSPHVQRKLNKLMEQFEKTQSLKIANTQNTEFNSGTKFIREYNGRKHQVLAVEQGFEYNGKIYKSLSAIANEITGTRWNGKRFFGVAK